MDGIECDLTVVLPLVTLKKKKYIYFVVSPAATECSGILNLLLLENWLLVGTDYMLMLILIVFSQVVVSER